VLSSRFPVNDNIKLQIYFTGIGEKVRPFIDIWHLCCLRELLTEFRESRRMGSV
jgi:hypothetical protein